MEGKKGKQETGQGRIFCYLRVSTIEQDTEKFKTDIRKYANERLNRTVKEADFIEEKVTGKKDFKQRSLFSEILNKVTKGDIIITPELSRLARSLGQIVEIVHQIDKAGAYIHFIKEGISTDDKNDIMRKMYIHLLGMFAEFESDIKSERIKEGMRARSLRGLSIGRTKGLGRKIDFMPETDRQDIKEKIRLGLSLNKVSRDYKVSPLTLRAWLEENNLHERDKKHIRTRGKHGSQGTKEKV